MRLVTELIILSACENSWISFKRNCIISFDKLSLGNIKPNTACQKRIHHNAAQADELGKTRACAQLKNFSVGSDNKCLYEYTLPNKPNSFEINDSVIKEDY